MARSPSDEPPILSWRLGDVEQKLFFPAGKHTKANVLLGLILGGLLTTAFFAALMFGRQRFPAFAEIFLERGWTQYGCTLLFFWGLALLFIKWRKLALQARSLSIRLVPEELGFILSPLTADDVLKNLYQQVDDPDAFILFNRVRRALLSLKNLGQVSEVDTIIHSQSDGDANTMETSYTLVKGFLWAMPVLGFIGTVQGLSVAIGRFGSVLAQNAEMSNLRDSLKGVVLGLSVAFDTTLVALVATLILQLLLTYLKKREEEFLEECDDYCHRNIVSKLRLLGHERAQV